MQALFKKPVLLAAFTLPVLLAILGFSNVIQGDFLWDDIAHQSSQLDRYRSFGDILGKSFFAGGNHLAHDTTPYYRPVISASYKVGQFFNDSVYDETVLRMDELRAQIPHMLTIFTHLVTTILVVVFTLQLIGNHPFRAWAALASGLIFATHPAHVESVSFIAGRTDTIATLFFLAALIALWRYWRTGSRLMLPVVGFLYLLSLLSKEIGIAFLFIAPAMLWLFKDRFDEKGARKAKTKPVYYAVPSGGRNAACPCGSGKKFKKCHGQDDAQPAVMPTNSEGTAREPLLLVASVAIATIVYFILRFQSDVSSLGLDSDATQAETFSRLLRAGSYYLFKLIWPLPLVHFELALPGWDKGIPGILIGLALIGGSIFAFRKGQAIFLFGIVWFIFTLGPSLLSAINPASSSPVSERLLYIPSVAFCLGLAGLLCIIPQKHIKAGLMVCVIGLSGFYSWAIYERNWDWQNQGALWASLARHEEGRLHKFTTNLQRVTSLRMVAVSSLAEHKYRWLKFKDVEDTRLLDKATRITDEMKTLVPPRHDMHTKALTSKAEIATFRAELAKEKGELIEAADFYKESWQRVLDLKEGGQGNIALDRSIAHTMIIEDQEREKVTGIIDIPQMVRARNMLLEFREQGHRPLWVTEMMSVVDHRIGIGLARLGKTAEGQKYLDSSDQEDVRLLELKAQSRL